MRGTAMGDVCDECGGTGEVCVACGMPEEVCDCEPEDDGGPPLERCSYCEGAGTDPEWDDDDEPPDADAQEGE